METSNTLKDCYYSPQQYKLMQLMGCKMKVSLNGNPVSSIVDHGVKHDLLLDEKFVGTEILEKIDCIEE